MDDDLEKPFKLNAALAALEGVVGFMTPQSYFMGTDLAEKLNMDPSLWSKKVNGHAPVREAELSKLVDLYRLGEYGLDYRIFRAKTEPEFLDMLRDAGVGTYGAHATRKFRHLLYQNGSRSAKYRISLIEVNVPRRRGGIGFGTDEGHHVPSIMPGSTVRVLCEGSPPGSHLLLFNERIELEITVLSPSLRVPETICSESAVILPSSPDWETFDVLGPHGHYRLFALWTTKDIADLVRNEVDIHQPSPSELSDDLMAKLYKILRTQEGRLATTFQDYVVEKN